MLRFNITSRERERERERERARKLDSYSRVVNYRTLRLLNYYLGNREETKRKDNTSENKSVNWSLINNLKCYLNNLVPPYTIT